MSVTINVYCDDTTAMQPGGSTSASIRYSAIDPGINTVRDLGRIIEKKAADDKDFAILFRQNPSEVLAAYGLNEDIRRELVLEASLNVSDCDFLSCISTCWYTCIFTSWNIAALGTTVQMD